MYYTIETKPPRPRRRAAMFIVPVQILLFVLWLFTQTENAPSGSVTAPSETPSPIPIPACLSYDGYMNAEPGDVLTVDASVKYKDCESKEHIQRLADFEQSIQYDPEVKRQIDEFFASAQNKEQYSALVEQYEDWKEEERALVRIESVKAMIGSKAKLSLSSPLFAGAIQPVSQEVQVINTAEDEGIWSWEVRPDRPGDYEISLVFSILNRDNDQVELMNERKKVFLHVEGTYPYYAATVWNGTTSFLTSLQGLVVGAVAAIAAVTGIIPALRRKKKGEQEPVAEAVPNRSGGYI